MALLDDIKAILVTGGITTGDVFLGGLPETPDAVIAILQPGGSEPHFAMGSIAAEVHQIQILTRGARDGWAETRDTARTVYGVLKFNTGETRNSVIYMSILALQQPFEITPDGAGQRPLFSCNFEVVRDDV